MIDRSTTQEFSKQFAVAHLYGMSGFVSQGSFKDYIGIMLRNSKINDSLKPQRPTSIRLQTPVSVPQY